MVAGLAQVHGSVLQAPHGFVIPPDAALHPHITPCFHACSAIGFTAYRNGRGAYSSDPDQPEAARRRQTAKYHRQHSTLALVVRTQDTSQMVAAQ